MKTIEEIRQETPLSVTSTDNPIYEVLEDVRTVIYKKLLDGGYTADGDTVSLQKGDRLRLLSCDDEKEVSTFRIGEGHDYIEIAHSQVQYISGNLGTQIES